MKVGFVFTVLVILCSTLLPNLELYGQGMLEKNDSRSLINSFLEQAEHYNNQLSFDTAQRYCDSAISLSARIDDKLLLAGSYGVKGQIVQKDHKLATPLLRKSITLSIENGFDSILARAYLTLGQIMKDQGKTDSVFYYFNGALEIFERIKDSSGIAKAYANIAVAYKLVSEYDKALENNLKSFHLYKELNMAEEAVNPLINLGSVYERLKEYDTAMACYNLAYHESLNFNSQEVAHQCLLNIGVIYYRLKDYEASLENFLIVIDFFESIDDKHELILLYSNVSLVYKALGYKEKQMESIKRSLELAEIVDNIPRKMKALNNLAIFLKNEKKYAEAEKYFLQSLKLAENTGYIKDISKALVNLSALYKETGNPEKALDYYMHYSVVKDSILNETKVRAIAELEAKYEKKNDEAIILQLLNEGAQRELEKKDIRLERNTILGTGTTIVLLLIMGLIMYRYRVRKNRIISVQKIQQLEDEKNLLEAQSLILGQENERKRIAQELHDGIGVIISTAKIHFSKVLQITKDEKTLDLVQKANNLLKDAGEEVRGISHNMMPGVLSKFGLADAIEDLFDEVADLGTVEVQIDLTDCEGRLPENTEIMLFRVVQEMLNNTLKYAETRKITFSAKRQHGYLHLHYTDDGKGFDEKTLPQNTSLGISGIRSRINFLRGKVQIKSILGEGVSYLISIPI